MGVKLPIDDVRKKAPPASPLVEACLDLVQDMVRRKFAESGVSWEQFRFGEADRLIGLADLAEIEQRILATGHRFDWSAGISARERPEIYKSQGEGGAAEDSFSHPGAPESQMDGKDRLWVGVGDNVVRHERDMTGVAQFIRSNERVLALLTNGVPPGTVAIIDDSGGTLTAPIIEQFAGVICAGGTVRSHLGILTREYNIPCVMNAKIANIRTGDLVTIQSSAASKTTEDYQTGTERVARIWRSLRPDEDQSNG